MLSAFFVVAAMVYSPCPRSVSARLTPDIESTKNTVKTKKRRGVTKVLILYPRQHSITFSACPASEVSLYRDCISIPVRYIVRIT